MPEADRPPQSFLTLAVSEPVNGRMEGPFRQLLRKYPVESLQLRSVSNGRVTRTLLRSLGMIDAVSAADGTVVAAVDYGCRSQLFRIDPASGQRRLIRVIADSAQDIALSPDGRRLAYDTVPKSQLPPCQPARQPLHPVPVTISPGGSDVTGPGVSVTAIVNLATGATVKIPDQESNPVWSPDGTRIAVGGPGANVVVQLSAARLHYLTAEQLRPPRGCGFNAMAWTSSGLISTVGCDVDDGSRQPYFEERSLAGKILVRSALPRCADGVTTAVAGRTVLVEAGLGYGSSRPCGIPKPGGYAIRFMLLRGTRFATVATLPEPSGLFFFLGW